MKTLALLSDSTGDLGERFLQALITQYPRNTFALKVFSFVNQDHDVDRVFDQIEPLAPILFHTTVLPHLKKQIESFARRHALPVYDLTGPVAAFLERVSGEHAELKVPALHELDQTYEKRIQALDFTVRHDDGLHAESWNDADILLTGVSRTSKTPTSIYLAYKGYRVANIPLILGLPLPDLENSPARDRIVGLTLQPGPLQAIRRQRATQEHIPDAGYMDLELIYQELAAARHFFSRLHCPVIDVTHHAIEETGALVLKALHQR